MPVFRILTMLLILAAVAGLLWLVGRVKLVGRLNDNEKATQEVEEYHRNLVEWANSGGENRALFAEVALASSRVERHLGYDNVVHATRVGYMMYNGVRAIPIVVEAVQREFDDPYYRSRGYEGLQAVSNLLMRHTGRRHDLSDSLRDRIANPFLCIGEGWRAVVSLPITLLRMFGLISERRAVATQDSLWFKLFSLLTFVTTIGSFVVAYIADREKVDAAIEALLSAL